MTWLGLDIGGANLKAADGHGWARSVPFPLWREPEALPAALTELVSTAPAGDRLAVTMTGELCDSFRNKADGVRHILAAAESAANGRSVAVYLVDGRWATMERACRSPSLAASSNWHALARFASRFTEGEAGLIVDVGSTTTDIVPIVGGVPSTQGRDDTARLLSGELVYTGVGRTPVCAITRTLPWRGSECPVAAEVFATAADAYLLLNELPEEPDQVATSDGRPRTRQFARERLARMICADTESIGKEDARRMALRVHEVQLAALADAIERVTQAMPRGLRRVVLSGEGEFLARQAVQRVLPECSLVSLADRLGGVASICGPAHALAVLATETNPAEVLG